MRSRNLILATATAGALALMAAGSAVPPPLHYAGELEGFTPNYGRRKYRRGGGKRTPAWYKGSRFAKRASRRGGNPAAHNRA